MEYKYGIKYSLKYAYKMEHETKIQAWETLGKAIIKSNKTVIGILLIRPLCTRLQKLNWLSNEWFLSSWLWLNRRESCLAPWSRSTAFCTNCLPPTKPFCSEQAAASTTGLTTQLITPAAIWLPAFFRVRGLWMIALCYLPCHFWEETQKGFRWYQPGERLH